jgi:hypothetical protein
MGYAELIEKLQALPEDKRAEVFDFVEFLASRFAASGAAGKRERAEWTEAGFAAFSMGQALRDMDDDPVTYSRDDLRESWQ